MPSPSNDQHMTWLIFALLTVACWGLYGVCLHAGQQGMNVAGAAPDPNARYKAFLFVGIAYFLIAVLAPLAILVARGASWSFAPAGMTWSLVAGVVGAIGAFCVLLAFGAKGSPAVVMAIIFAGAPIINAIVALAVHPPAGGWGALRWQFFAGILLAALGGCLVTLYKPPPAPASARSTPAANVQIDTPQTDNDASS